jgi:hypothetical protein
VDATRGVSSRSLVIQARMGPGPVVFGLPVAHNDSGLSGICRLGDFSPVACAIGSNEPTIGGLAVPDGSQAGRVALGGRDQASALLRVADAGNFPVRACPAGAGLLITRPVRSIRSTPAFRPPPALLPAAKAHHRASTGPCYCRWSDVDVADGSCSRKRRHNIRRPGGRLRG